MQLRVQSAFTLIATIFCMAFFMQKGEAYALDTQLWHFWQIFEYFIVIFYMSVYIF